MRSVIVTDLAPDATTGSSRTAPQDEGAARGRRLRRSPRRRRSWSSRIARCRPPPTRARAGGPARTRRRRVRWPPWLSEFSICSCGGASVRTSHGVDELQMTDLRQPTAKPPTSNGRRRPGRRYPRGPSTPVPRLQGGCHPGQDVVGFGIGRPKQLPPAPRPSRDPTRTRGFHPRGGHPRRCALTVRPGPRPPRGSRRTTALRRCCAAAWMSGRLRRRRGSPCSCRIDCSPRLRRRRAFARRWAQPASRGRHVGPHGLLFGTAPLPARRRCRSSSWVQAARCGTSGCRRGRRHPRRRGSSTAPRAGPCRFTGLDVRDRGRPARCQDRQHLVDHVAGRHGGGVEAGHTSPIGRRRAEGRPRLALVPDPPADLLVVRHRRRRRADVHDVGQPGVVVAHPQRRRGDDAVEATLVQVVLDGGRGLRRRWPLSRRLPTGRRRPGMTRSARPPRRSARTSMPGRARIQPASHARRSPELANDTTPRCSDGRSSEPRKVWARAPICSATSWVTRSLAVAVAASTGTSGGSEVTDVGDAAVVGPEVVTPVGDAVRLVDHQGARIRSVSDPRTSRQAWVVQTRSGEISSTSTWSESIAAPRRRTTSSRLVS